MHSGTLLSQFFNSFVTGHQNKIKKYNKKQIYLYIYFILPSSIFRIINFDKVRSTVNFQQRYEKPTDWRRRYMYERCKRVYDSEMSRKISLVIRTHRVDPWHR